MELVFLKSYWKNVCTPTHFLIEKQYFIYFLANKGRRPYNSWWDSSCYSGPNEPLLENFYLAVQKLSRDYRFGFWRYVLFFGLSDFWPQYLGHNFSTVWAFYSIYVCKLLQRIPFRKWRNGNFQKYMFFSRTIIMCRVL